MKTWIFVCMFVVILLRSLSTLGRKPSQKKGCIDVIISAHNEGPCLAQSLDNLLCNPYFCRVICVNGGSADNTRAVMAEVKCKWGNRFIVVMQKNTGKGGTLINSLNYITCDQVFLSNVDTYVPPDQDGMGYMLAEIERGADVVGGIPPTALKGAGPLPYTRATVKLPVIVMKRTLQQFLGGASFIISGVRGMFCTDVLCKFGLLDRTKVEDLDLIWILVANDYRIRQANRCIVYSQECNSLREEWRCWRRWIVEYAVCMRLYKRFLLSRFGIFSIFPMSLVAIHDAGIYLITWLNEFITTGLYGVVLAMFLLIWIGVVCATGAPSTRFHRCWLLVPLVPLSVVYVLSAYTTWTIYGFIAFFIGREPQHDEPTRYSVLVEALTAYSQPSVTGTEKLSEV